MTVTRDDSPTAVHPTRIKAVIFDLDGTLLDTESLSCRAVIDSFELIDSPIPADIRSQLKEGGDLLPWELKSAILGMRGSEWIPMVLGYAQERWGVEMDGMDWRECWISRGNRKACKQDDKMLAEVDKFWRAWELRLNELCAEVKACPGAKELVEGLRAAKIPMAIATSSRAASVKKKRCKHEKMFEAFQEIVPGDDENVKNGKPAPDIYLEAAKRLGVHPSECLVFEDALTGAKAGKSAGCRVIAVPDLRMDHARFRSVADEVLNDMFSFSGKKWGIPFDMAGSEKSS
mmetsp:Transcript_2792/g.5815  ORF Transcript_2792/g.5815 Transcript_2792/m.5815 type:complete len:289 (-) Transcript_2792:152-1018(-)